MAYTYKPCNPAEYDRCIQIQSKVKAQDAYGAETVTLSPFVTDGWAKRKDGATREFYAGTLKQGLEGSKIAVALVMYTMRYVEGLSQDMVIIEDGIVYDIVDTAELGRKMEHQVICKTNAV